MPLPNPAFSDTWKRACNWLQDFEAITESVASLRQNIGQLPPEAEARLVEAEAAFYLAQVAQRRALDHLSAMAKELKCENELRRAL
jgi:hypothetical protein